MSIHTFAIALIVSVGFVTTAYADHHKGDGMKDKPTITDIVVNSDQHTTLETAVVEAGLAETLSSEGEYTVFAPTDDAFAALPEGALEELLKPENRDQLSDILKYHVVEGYYLTVSTLLAAEAGGTDYPTATTVNGEQLTFHEDGNSVMIRDAQGNEVKVIKTGIKASNGVVHVIDGVLMP